VDAADRLISLGGPSGGAPEAVDIRTADGWSLRAHVREPVGAPCGVAVLAHALGADKSAFERTSVTWRPSRQSRQSRQSRPSGGFASFLVARGWTTVALDLRGHGESHAVASGRAGPCRYDAIVGHDLPAACDFARWQARGDVPVVVVGHGLGGHAAIAAAAARAVDAGADEDGAGDAIVALAAVPWIPELDPSRLRRFGVRLLSDGAAAVERRAGRFASLRRHVPRRLLGRDGAILGVAADVLRFARSGRWESADGRVDYLASLRWLRLPVLGVASDGDVFASPPACAERFVAQCGGRRELFRVSEGDRGTRPPSAMGLVTSGRVQRVWARIEAWMRAARSR
jgi:pimeloyl-ACP methyl ester carboxylesterase